jgi:hypothetical protein
VANGLTKGPTEVILAARIYIHQRIYLSEDKETTRLFFCYLRIILIYTYDGRLKSRKFKIVNPNFWKKKVLSLWVGSPDRFVGGKSLNAMLKCLFAKS